MRALRLAAFKSTDWFRADCLAHIHIMITHKIALWLLASGGALRAGQSTVVLAQGILGAEHIALRLLALHVAFFQIGLVHLGAPGLTSPRPAHRLTVLLTDRLLAVPHTMRHAALSGCIRHQLLPRRAIRHRRLLVPLHPRRRGHQRPGRGRAARLPRDGVQVLHASRWQGDGYPDRALLRPAAQDLAAEGVGGGDEEGGAGKLHGWCGLGV
mmetsp:Transcript_25525/g.56152  ORF Transcript_25525/g.56152 Transcript_25525/m.56152 type:complete len:212 (+) Transcript_25525:894-1529(+)